MLFLLESLLGASLHSAKIQNAGEAFHSSSCFTMSQPNYLGALQVLTHLDLEENVDYLQNLLARTGMSN
jgi:hypothetical protein